MSVRLSASAKDAAVINEIADRAVREFFRIELNRLNRLNPMHVAMDITAAHLNGCRLDLRALLRGSVDDFVHDVAGIRRHLDRTTGKLQNCFEPRFRKGSTARRHAGTQPPLSNGDA
jgi:hypothetical protein